MSYEFKLPDIGEGVVEGEIIAWLVNEGDTVTEDQPIVEVLTDKANVVIPSPKAGRVVSLPWKVGDSVPVGKTLVVLDVGGGAALPAPAAAAVAPPKPAAVAAVQPGPTASMVAPASTVPPVVRAPAVVSAPPAAKVAAPAPAAQARPAPAAPPPVALNAEGSGEESQGELEDESFSGDPSDLGPTEGVLAAPTTRRLARELGVQLTKVAPTGKFGRVTREDVERAAAEKKAPARAVAQPTPSAAPPAPNAAATKPGPAPTPDRMKLKGIRKAQAEGMVKSFYTAPHFTYVEEIDMTELVRVRTALRPLVKARVQDLSYLPFIIKALCTTLKEHPFLNASLDDAAQEIVFHKVYNLGIAVATDHGLTVPVIHAADQKNLVELASELADKSDRARRLKLTKEDFGGSTFTITSLGKVGGVMATPILNPGEVAILGIHAMRISPKWDEVKSTFVPRETMNVSFSFDHRVVDGFTGATGVQRLKELLETPELMMLEMR